MVTEAQRGLDWRSEFGRGGTEVGIARARDIVNGRNLSEDTVKQKVSGPAKRAIPATGGSRGRFGAATRASLGAVRLPKA